MNVKGLIQYWSKCAFLSLVFAVPVYSPISIGEVIFNDDFSTGDFARTQSGAQWTSQVYVKVRTSPALVGQNSAEFLFKGSPDLSEDAFSELRFDLGRVYPEIWLQFHLYIPSNYEHRDASSTDNNKVLRLWGADYNDSEKLGLSTWRSGGGSSSLIADWSRPGEGIGPKGETYSSFITDSDKGRWMKLRIHVLAAQSSSSPGTLRVWKNDSLIIDNSGIVANYSSGEAHGYRYGYLLGWSNSGFNVDTTLNVDGVVFATSANDLNGGPAGGAAPNPPTIEVQ